MGSKMVQFKVLQAAAPVTSSRLCRPVPLKHRRFNRHQPPLAKTSADEIPRGHPRPLYMRGGDQAKRFLALRKLSVERAQAAERQHSARQPLKRAYSSP